MRRHLLLALVTATASLSLTFLASHPRAAEVSSAIALTGQVSSTEESAMEGVLVSAKKDGSTITITVVSDERGRYSFPTTKLGPGQYSLKVRAIGYEIDGPKTVDLTAGTAATADLKLRK